VGMLTSERPATSFWCIKHNPKCETLDNEILWTYYIKFSFAYPNAILKKIWEYLGMQTPSILTLKDKGYLFFFIFFMGFIYHFYYYYY